MSQVTSPSNSGDSYVADALGLNMSNGAFVALVLVVILIAFLCFCKAYFLLRKRCNNEKESIPENFMMHRNPQLPGNQSIDPPCYDNVTLQIENESGLAKVATDEDPKQCDVAPPSYDVITGNVDTTKTNQVSNGEQ